MTTPAFVSTRPQLKLNGEARDDLEQALNAMVVNLPLNGSAHAELQLNNWGQTGQGDTPDFLFNDIALGKSLEILIGADDRPSTIFTGEITGIEERFGDGSPALVLLLQDRLHRLARSRHSRSFDDQSPDDIVRSIASDAGLQADASISAATATWHQLNESDLAFLLRLLGRFDIALRLEGNALRAKPEQPDPAPLAIDAQDSALKIRLLADLNHQPVSVKVQGYNVGTAEAVDHDSSAMQPAPRDKTAAATLTDLGWPGEEVVPQPFARSSAEADAYAAAHFRRQAKQFVAGEIVVQGEAALRSGREIELTGVSPRLRGKYQVVHCLHRFDNAGGFETHLQVNRSDWSV